VYNLNTFMQPPKPRRIFTRLVLAVVLLSSLTLFVVQYLTIKLVIENSNKDFGPAEKIVTLEDKTKPFPIGVNPEDKLIVERIELDEYINTYLSFESDNSRKSRFIDRVLAQLVKWDWYQNLASSVSRILVIYSGERHEEVVKNFTKILKWNDEESARFYKYVTSAEPELSEGKFFPGRYVVPYDATPEIVADLIYDKFSEEVLDRYDTSIDKQVPINTALTIASLLEREAYDFVDMRYISGIIWNRLFIDMPLQLDATLQYAKGSQLFEPKWWPKVVPKDKYIDSPYNTYENTGLPPGPISNPSVEAVVAALNPRQTDCLFYFHDTKGKFYCTKTYEEHVAKLKEIYGKGS
jgi:cell division protein YceG involved in septum cleavage